MKRLVTTYQSEKYGPFKKGFIEPCRNAKCPCGSGKKFKQCCLIKINAPIREQVIAASIKSEGYFKRGK